VTLLGVTDRAYLTVEEACRYAIGDPANPLLTLNAVDANGVLWACEEPPGWRATGAATPLDRKQYGHGAFPGDTYLTERVLPLNGSAAAPTPQLAQAAADYLARVLYWNLTGDALYTHLDEDPPKTVFVRPAGGEPKIEFADPCYFDFQITLVAPDPYKYGTTATYGPVRLPASGAAGGPGRTYPRRYAVIYGTPGATPPRTGIVVPNVGNADAHAIYTVTGPVPAPQVHLGNGQYIAFGVTLAATDVLTINTATGQATVNGTSRLDTLLTGSTFPLIPAGGTEVRLGSLGGGSDQTASLTITTAPTWQ
jgi:hypothetical protein